MTRRGKSLAFLLPLKRVFDRVLGWIIAGTLAVLRRINRQRMANVLGRLVEVSSGQGLDQFLESRIFKPLGMVDTGFWVPPDKRARLVDPPVGATIHPDRDVAVSVPELSRELPVPPDGLDTATCEADRQLEVGRADGLRAVCADLVERSVP